MTRNPVRGSIRDLLLAGIDGLPVLPTVLSEIVKLDPTSSRCFEGIVQLAERDPLMAARIVTLANSARYQGRDPVLTVRGAVTRLGTRAVTDMLAALSLERVFSPTGPRARELWRHTLLTAVCSREVAKEVAPHLEPGQVYLAALLHDVGHFIMLDVAPEILTDPEGRLRTRKLLEAERSAYGLDHTQLGERAAKAWGLPAWLTRLIAGHHQVTTRLSPDLRPPAQMLQLGDYIASRFDFDGEQEDHEAAQQDLAERVEERFSSLVEGVSLLPIFPVMEAESARMLVALGF